MRFNNYKEVNKMEETNEKTIISVISSKDEKSGNKDGKDWIRYGFKFGDTAMSTFDNRFKDFKTGDVVEVMYKKSGMYNNILDMKLAEQSQIVTADKIKEYPDQQVWIEKDKRIVRQNCNQRAIETLRLMNEIQPEKVKEILETNEGNMLNVLDVLAQHWENIVWGSQNNPKEIKEVAF